MTQVGEAFVRIRADTSGFKSEASRGVAGATKSAGQSAAASFGASGKQAGQQFAAGASTGATKTRGAFTSAAKGIAASFAGIAVARFLKDSVTAAVAAETQMTRAKASFQALGVGAKESGVAMQEAGKRAIRLGFDDETAAQSLATLTRSSGNVKTGMKGLATAFDVARVRGVDLTSATRMVTGAQLGNTRVLRQLGLTLAPVTKSQDALKRATTALADESRLLTREGKGASDARKKEIDERKEQIRQQIEAIKGHAAEAKARDKTATGAAALSLIQQKLGNQAESFAKTSGGELQQLQVRYENLKETIGAGLLPVVIELGKVAAAGLTEAAASARDFKGAIQPIVPTISAVASAGADVARSLGGPGLLATAATYLVVSRNAGALRGGLGGVAAALGSVRAEIATNPAGRLAGAFTSAGGVVKGVASGIARSFGPQLIALGVAGVVAGIITIRSNMTSLAQEAQQAADAIQGVFDARLAAKGSALAVTRAKLERESALESSRGASQRLRNEQLTIQALERSGASRTKLAAQQRVVTAAEREHTLAVLRAQEASQRLAVAQGQLRAANTSVAASSAKLQKEIGGIATKARESAVHVQWFGRMGGTVFLQPQKGAAAFAKAMREAAATSDTMSAKAKTTSRALATLALDLGHVPTKHEIKVAVDIIAAGGNIKQVEKKLGVVHKTKTKPKIDADPHGIFAVAAEVISTKKKLATPVVIPVRFEVRGAAAANAAYDALIGKKQKLAGTSTTTVSSRMMAGLPPSTTGKHGAGAPNFGLQAANFPLIPKGVFDGITRNLKKSIMDAVREARSSLIGISSSIADTAGRVIDAATAKAIASVQTIVDNPLISQLEGGISARGAARTERDLRRAITDAQRRITDARAAVGQLAPSATPQERADAQQAVLDAVQAEQDAEAGLTDFLDQQQAQRLRDADDTRKADRDATIEKLRQDGEDQKDALVRQLADLTAHFNDGSLGWKDYMAAVGKILSDNGVTFQTAGDALGLAFADAFKAQLADLRETVAQIVRAGLPVSPTGGAGEQVPSTAAEVLSQLGAAKEVRSGLLSQRGDAQRAINAANREVEKAKNTATKEDDKRAAAQLAEAKKALVAVNTQIKKQDEIIQLLAAILDTIKAPNVQAASPALRELVGA